MNIYKMLPLSCFILAHLALASASPEFPLPERFRRTSKSVFDEFSELLKKYNPLNLGEGAPDYPPPENIQTALAKTATSKDSSLSQYSPDHGHPRLLKAVSKLYSQLSNQTLSPDKNVIITVGAMEALFITFLTHTFHGQEWIVFEPYFEPYVPMIKAAHGVPKFIKLKPTINNRNVTSADWSFDREELASLFNEKTKGILINTPHNPLGKVFTLEELTFIGNLAKKWNALVVSDEVYQFLTFDNSEHIRIGALPGMFERTITIASAGKMFGATGYRIGWAYGDSKLIDNLKVVQSFIVSCPPTPIQEAVAIALEKETTDFGKPYSFFERLRKETEAKRNYFYQTLSRVGMTPILPEGGYFMTANWTTISNGFELDSKTKECDDYKFAKWLIKTVKVLGLPMSSFYKEVSECSGKDLIRFTIIKANETYQEVAKSFMKWKPE